MPVSFYQCGSILVKIAFLNSFLNVKHPSPQSPLCSCSWVFRSICAGSICVDGYLCTCAVDVAFEVIQVAFQLFVSVYRPGLDGFSGRDAVVVVLSFSGTANCLSTKRPFVTQCRSGPHLSQCHIRSSFGYFSPLNLFSNICLQTSGCVTNIPTVTLPFGQFRCRASASKHSKCTAPSDPRQTHGDTNGPSVSRQMRHAMDIASQCLRSRSSPHNPRDGVARRWPSQNDHKRFLRNPIAVCF